MMCEQVVGKLRPQPSQHPFQSSARFFFALTYSRSSAARLLDWGFNVLYYDRL